MLTDLRWAWQNTHLTRHISPSSRISHAPCKTRFSPKSGRVRKRLARPRLGLTERLANLHLLLRSSSFERWPLRVTFYAEDVHRVWLRWLNQHPELTGNGGLREGLQVALDASTKRLPAAESADEAALKGIRAIDVTYAPLKDHLAKSRALLSESSHATCNLCPKALPSTGASLLTCPNPECDATAHITCLSAHFLSSAPAETLIPTTGHCPSCKSPLEWQDLVKELSLRMRGEKEIEALFKPPRTRKTKAKAAESEASEDELLPENPLPGDDEDEDEWHRLPDTSDVEMEEDERAVVRSDLSPPVRKRKANASARAGAARSESVIEDSDWEGAEVIA